MFKILLFLLSSPGTKFFIDAANPEETSDKVYPLMLMVTTDNALRRPTSLEVSQGFAMAYENYDFNGPAEEEEMLLFCPATVKGKKSGEKESTHDANDNYCLAEMKEIWWVSTVKFLKLPIRFNKSKCKREPEPFISKIFSKTNANQENNNDELEVTSCGPDFKGKLYRYGYQILLRKDIFDRVRNKLDSVLSESKVRSKGNILDYEIYRFCYDVEKKQILYTQHTILSPKLLYNYHLQKQEEKEGEGYQMNSSNFKLEELEVAERVKKYEHQKSNNKEASDQQTSDAVPGEPAQPPEYTTAKLVPASDFAFELWKKPTFHYLNVDLMNEKLFYLWNRVLDAIQKHAHNFQLEFNVYTKTFNPPKENVENEENIETESKPQAPQIWIKVVHLHNKEHIDSINSISRAVAIIANNHMNDELNKKISTEYCDKKNYCKHFQKKEYSDVHQYIKCCEINKNIEQLYNFDLNLKTAADGTKELVWIESLINETDLVDHDDEDVKQELPEETKTET